MDLVGIEDLSLYPCFSREPNASHPSSTGCDEAPEHFLDNEAGIHYILVKFPLARLKLSKCLGLADRFGQVTVERDRHRRDRLTGEHVGKFLALTAQMRVIFLEPRYCCNTIQ